MRMVLHMGYHEDGEGNKQFPAEGTEAVGGKLQSDYTLVFCFNKINIYLSHGGS